MRPLLPCVAISLGLLVAVACGSADQNRTLPSAAGVAGDGGNGAEDSGGAPASAGSFSHGGSEAKAGADTGGAAGESNLPTAGDGGLGHGGAEQAGGGENGGAGGSGSDPEVPPTVIALGCFAASGDGWDFIDGAKAKIMANGLTCGGSMEASNDPNGFAPLQVPTSFSLTRKFVVDDAILTAAKLTLTFASDDAAAFTLNGHELGACTPPTGDIGFCSQTCQTLEFPADFLLGGGSINELVIEVINLLSVDAGDGNFGWTGVSYSICAAGQ